MTVLRQHGKPLIPTSQVSRMLGSDRTLPRLALAVPVTQACLILGTLLSQREGSAERRMRAEASAARLYLSPQAGVDGGRYPG